MGSKTESTSNSAGSGFQDVEDTNSIDLANLQVHKSVGTTIEVKQTDHGAIEAAIGLVEDESENTRIFSAGVIEQTNQALGGVLVYADDADARRTEFTATQLDENRAFAAGALRETLAASAGTVDKAFSLVGQGFSKFADGLGSALTNNSAIASQTVSEITDFSELVLQDLNEQATQNIQAVSDATRSDAANSLDQVVKLAGVAFVVLGLTTVFMRAR